MMWKAFLILAFVGSAVFGDESASGAEAVPADDSGSGISQVNTNSSGCNGDPNAHSGCGVNCGRTCSTYKKKNVACILICYVNGCDCNDGYVYDPNVKKCVLPKECTPTCGLNEKYSSCTNGGCGHKDCSEIGQPIKCVDPIPGSCVKGCVCADGYLRAENGTCVLEKDCPLPECGGDPNAHSGCGINCGRTCDTYNSTDPIACPAICNLNGCDCNEGYVLDGNLGRCVLPEDCTPKSDDRCPGQNEFYNTCISGCSNQSCDSIGKVFNCPIMPAVCREGCRCKNGFYRNAQNVCVPQSECSTGCGGDPNAKPGCGVNCGKTCVPAPCPKICKVGGCDCIDGYVYDDNVKKCVLPGECTPNCKAKPNEVFDVCPAPCPPRRCDVDDRLIRCAAPPKPGDAACKPDCRCIDGYARLANGTCVLREQCETPPKGDDQCPGQYEFYDTCISGCGNQSCDSIGKIINCPIMPAVCRQGCRCKSGFYRNTSNVCVPESECPTPSCPNGEIWSRCPTIPCEGDYCPKDRNSLQSCPVGIVCSPPRCTCGLLDKKDRLTGKCINANTCPPFKCEGPNESYNSCPPSCPGEKCSDYVNGIKCPPFIIGIVVPCRPACRCNDGYYRNSNGTCVKADQCGPINTTTNIPVTIETATTAKPAISSGDGIASLKTGITNFNGKFLYDRMKLEEGKNIIASPYSVITPLVQLALYASGDCLTQLTSILNVSSKEQIRSAFPAVVASLAGQTSVNFSTAAKVYSDEKYPLSENFLEDSVNVVHAEAQELDFSKNTEAANTINAWVESQTNNRIHDLIQASDLSSITRLVLVNAIYFKGEWHYAFNKNNTIKNTDFFLNDGSTKKTDLMYQERQFNYGEVPELNCTVLQMFYKGDNFSMVVVLPNEKDGIISVAEKLQLQPNFDKVIGSLKSQKVKVYLPPFKIETTTDLSVILRQMGVTKIFDPQNSGLSGMLKTPEDTHVSKAVQKAFIEVNEEGSEAAAANAVVVGVTSVFRPEPPKEIIFRCDRSFLYYIVCNDNVLFAGAVVDPDSN